MSKEKKKKKDKHKSSKSSKKHKKKRERDSSSSSSESEAAAPPAAAAAAPMPSFADLYPMPKRRAIGPVGPISALPATAGELARRNERAERFLPSAADTALAAARSAAPALHTSTQGGEVRGQSQMLEKSYTRLTTMPNAFDVRPLPVLREAFEHVGRKWQAERDYPYACDQLKAIRQDLTVQRLTQADAPRATFAMQVYETHATLALISGDLGEFGACQAALVPLHEARRSNRAAEFGAYRLLHAATHRGASLAAELPAILGSLRPSDKAHDAVIQAMRIGVAMQLDEACAVLSMLPSVAFHGARLLAPRLDWLRERALYELSKAYLPSLPLSVIARRLGYADDVSRCERFLRGLGAVPTRTSARDETELDTKAALRVLGQRAEAARAEQIAAAQGGGGGGLSARGHAEVGPPIPFDLLDGW